MLVFAPDVLRGELDVEHRGVDLCMTHQMLQGRQRHPGPHQIGATGVPKSMRVGVTYSTPHSMVAEQRAKPGRGHGLTTLPAF